MALPGHSNLAAARSLDNCKCCILEEIDFVEDSLQRETLDVAERYIGREKKTIISSHCLLLSKRATHQDYHPVQISLDDHHGCYLPKVGL